MRRDIKKILWMVSLITGVIIGKLIIQIFNL